MLINCVPQVLRLVMFLMLCEVVGFRLPSVHTVGILPHQLKTLTSNLIIFELGENQTFPSNFPIFVYILSEFCSHHSTEHVFSFTPEHRCFELPVCISQPTVGTTNFKVASVPHIPLKLGLRSTTIATCTVVCIKDRIGSDETLQIKFNFIG